MATKNAPKASKASLLQTVTDCAYQTGVVTDDLRKAFVAAGGDQDEPRKALIVGRMMWALRAHKYTQEMCLLALAKTGLPKEKQMPKAMLKRIEDDRRNTAEELAYGAARVYLSARLKEWGLKTTQTQGGDRTGDKDGMSTEKLALPGRPKVATHVELGEWAQAWASGGYDFFLLNKAHSAVTSDHGAQLMGAFADFLDSVKEVNAKFAK